MNSRYFTFKPKNFLNLSIYTSSKKMTIWQRNLKDAIEKISIVTNSKNFFSTIRKRTFFINFQMTLKKINHIRI